MKKFIYIIFIVFNISILSQTKSTDFVIEKPDYISAKSEFQVSTVLTFNNYNPNKCKYYIYFNNSIKLLRTTCNNINGSKLLIPKIIKENGIADKCYLFDLDLPNSIVRKELPVQLIFNFKSLKITTEEINFKLLYSFEDGEFIKISSLNDSDVDEKIGPLYISFYNPEIIENYSLPLKSNFFLVEPFNKKLKNDNEILNFWIKTFDNTNTIFSIEDDEQKKLFTLTLNKYRVLELNTSQFYILNDEMFLSKNAWYHFTINKNIIKNKVEIYCNNKNIFTISPKSINEVRILKIGGEKTELEIDNLTHWDYGDSLSLIDNNKNCFSFNPLNSALIEKYSFSADENIPIYSGTEKIILNTKMLTTTDAPLFSALPTLNIKMSNSFYLLEWHNHDPINVEKYILEKSFDNKNFSKIYEVEANKDKMKIYNCADPKLNIHNLIYYRVKQINKNQAPVYSKTIKIGQCNEEEIFFTSHNYPNPFNPVTTIEINSVKRSEVEINVYNLVGTKIITIYKGVLEEGIHKFNFDGSNLASGIYFYEIINDKTTLVEKMVLTK